MIIFSPKDVLEAVKPLAEIPQGVFDALLVEKLDKRTGTAILYQKDVLNAIVSKSNGEITSNMMYNNKWMDFEDHYRSMGWQVEYFKTPYYSTDDSWFDFRGGL
jgi:hypothetical protein